MGPPSQSHPLPAPMRAKQAVCRSPLRPILWLAAAAFCGSCAPAGLEMQQAVICFIEATQDQDGERWIGCAADDLADELLGPASGGPPEERPRAAGEHLQAVARSFLEQRKTGSIDVSGSDGLVLTHFLSLGRGAYYVFGVPRREEGVDLLRMEVRLFYQMIDYPDHRRKGQTLWRLGHPLGTLYPFIFGMTRVGVREELSRVEVDWILERDASERWRVRGGSLLPETAVYSTIGS